MVTTRTPINRSGKFKITPEAVDIFRRMQDVPDCYCGILKPDLICASCEQYKQLHRELHATLKLPPHLWPAIVHPDVECDCPPGHTSHAWWSEAQALHRALSRLAYPDEGAA
jgi:hypothetical protein